MAVTIVWSAAARTHLLELRDELESDERLMVRLLALVEALRYRPRLGHAGSAPSIRELAIGGTPYVVVYRVDGKRVVIGTIWKK